MSTEMNSANNPTPSSPEQTDNGAEVVQSGRSLWQTWSRAAVDLLCPPQCQSCGVDLLNRDRDVLLCGPCLSLLASSRGPVCPRCAAPVPSGSQSHPDCPRCETTQFHFRCVAGLGVYTGELRQAVLRIKEPMYEPLALTLGRLIAEEVAARWPDFRADLVIPIPMYWGRRWTRGHNAPELLAESVSRQLRVPMAADALICARNVRRQSTLTPGERFKNVRGAFRASGAYALAGTRLLLIDDTLTTGATAGEAARMLKQTGSEEIRVAVAARGIGVD